jgi:hypothetical protein
MHRSDVLADLTALGAGSDGRRAGAYFGRGHWICLSGWLSRPARSALTA